MYLYNDFDEIVYNYLSLKNQLTEVGSVERYHLRVVVVDAEVVSVVSVAVVLPAAPPFARSLLTMQVVLLALLRVLEHFVRSRDLNKLVVRLRVVLRNHREVSVRTYVIFGMTYVIFGIDCPTSIFIELCF